MPKHHRLPLPKLRVRSDILHAVAMANVVFTVTRAHAEHHFNARVRLQADNDRLRSEIALLQEEIILSERGTP